MAKVIAIPEPNIALVQMNSVPGKSWHIGPFASCDRNYFIIPQEDDIIISRKFVLGSIMIPTILLQSY